MVDQPSVAAEAKDIRRRQRWQAIDQFVREYAPCENEDLLREMMVTICRLSADKVDRGDLKILNTALKELRYAFKVFTPYATIPKVSIFGSARTPETHSHYLEAKKFAELIGREGWMVITGAGGGIMRAGHHGASRESSFGVSIQLPFEQATNDLIADDAKLVNFKYFFTRKLMFIKEAEAVVLFPGGFGTQDEGFEALTLVQTAKTTPVPIVLCDAPGGTYWEHWRNYVKSELLGNRMVDEADMNLFFVTGHAEEAVAEILRFYRRYHSMRYVWDQLVIRMNSAISPQLVMEIQAEFADILTNHPIEQRPGPLPEEHGLFPDKPRLVMHFDRRNTGRLRMLINRINEAP